MRRDERRIEGENETWGRRRISFNPTLIITFPSIAINIFNYYLPFQFQIDLTYAIFLHFQFPLQKQQTKLTLGKEKLATTSLFTNISVCICLLITECLIVCPMSTLVS